MRGKLQILCRRLKYERGIVRGWVALLLRSSEIKPLSVREIWLFFKKEKYFFFLFPFSFFTWGYHDFIDTFPSFSFFFTWGYPCIFFPFFVLAPLFSFFVFFMHLSFFFFLPGRFQGQKKNENKKKTMSWYSVLLFSQPFLLSLLSHTLHMISLLLPCPLPPLVQVFLSNSDHNIISSFVVSKTVI